MEEFLDGITAAAGAHLGARWRPTGVTDLGDRASHRCALVHGDPITLFVKLAGDGESLAEIRGLALLHRHGAATPEPVAALPVTGGTLLITEALPEVRRAPAQWAAIGRSLATLHQRYARRFGLAAFDGYFGPLPQDNRPAGDSWTDFYAERRLLPALRAAVDAGRLPAELAAGVERVIARLPRLGGPEPRPALLHGDAQQNNFLSTADTAYLIDVAPYYGHPEVDLALLDYFAPVPPEVLDAYREITPIDPGFPERRELWRLFGYLAVVTVDGGAPFLGRIAAAVRKYA